MKLLNKKYIILILFTLLYIQTAIGDDILYPEKDATVDKWFSTSSYTSPIITYAGSDGTDFKRAFIEFDITNYSDSSAATNVKLYLYSNDENTAGEVYFQRLTQTWSEPITWNSQPTSYTSTNQASKNIYSTYTWYEIDVTEQFKDAIDSENGYYGIRLSSEEDDSHEAAKFMSIHEANKPYLKISTTSKLSGYVTNNLDNPVSTATITLNNSGGSTNSNDTGYYEITGLSSGTYSITATSPTHEDYSDTVIMVGNIEKNITMTRLSPVLTYTDTDTTVYSVLLNWRRNIVVDNVRIYKDTETRLLTTVASGPTSSGLYSDKNLDCNKGYVYWLQPMDGSVAGPKYRIDAKTDPCTDGGGGGTVPDPTPDLTPVVTPGPTVPPEINMTQEEWLNLTLEEKQDVLANITLMAPVDRLFSPLLEFKWEDVLVWGINLFLILCAVLALDSITTQKISEYTGLFAIIPGVLFAYLGGYLVI